MLPRMIVMMLLLVFVPQTPQRPDQQDCRKVESELIVCRNNLGGCQENLREANNKWEARLQEARRQADQENGQLRKALASAQADSQRSEQNNGQLKSELVTARNELKALQGKYETISNDLTSSRTTVDGLRTQNAQLQTSYDAKLAERQTAIDSLTREISGRDAQIKDKNKIITELTSKNVTLAEDVSRLGQSLKSAEQARVAAEQAKDELQQNLALLSAEEKKKPDVVLGVIQENQNKMDQSGAPVTVTPGKDGSIKRELVIGTLEVKPYPTEIPAGGKLQLIAIFTPRPLPGVIGGNSPWFVNLVYNPPPGINAVYNSQESFGEEVREVHIGTDHKWVWLVDPPKDSQAVLNATQMDILAGFQKDKVVRIAGQPVVLTRGKPLPGWFAVIFAAMKDNLTYILATIMTLLGIWAAYLTVRLKKAEVAKTEKAETPAQSEA